MILFKLVLIDYFVTIYAKKNKSFIELEDYEYNYINDSYKDQLKSFTKILFDPFKRNKKIEFSYNNLTFITTVGQLNFLKWALKNDIIKYMEEHYDEINAAHKQYLEDKKNKTKKNKEIKKLYNILLLNN